MIENERLKTTISIVNGQLKSQEDSQKIIEEERTKNKLLEDENTILKSQISSLATSLEIQTEKVTTLESELEKSEKSREQLKIQLEDLS